MLIIPIGHYSILYLRPCHPFSQAGMSDRMLAAMYDLLIVGGGVVGSYLAAEMAGLGLRVLVLEEHPAPGEDITCTGIVGRECLDLLNLPPVPGPPDPGNGRG